MGKRESDFQQREALLRRISALPSATCAEEAAVLFEAWRSGDRGAGVVLQNTATKIAASLAMRQLKRDTSISPEDYDDLLAEAMTEALVRLKDWDPAQGALSTYIAPRLGFAMDDFTRRENARGTGDHRAPPVLAATTVLSTDEEDEGPEMTSYDSSLTYAEPPEGYDDPLAVVLKGEVKDVLVDAIGGLTPWQQAVIHASYGLSGEERTHQEIADTYNVARQSVSETSARAEGGLRKILAGRPCLSADFVDTSSRTARKLSGAPQGGDAKAKDWLASDERARLKQVLRDMKGTSGYPSAAARPGRLSITCTGMSDSEFWNKYRPRVKKGPK